MEDTCSWKLLNASRPEEISFHQPALIWITNQENVPCIISVSSRDNSDEYQIQPGSHQLLITGAGRVTSLYGEIKYCEMDCRQLAKLQAFLDLATADEIDFSHAGLSAILSAGAEQILNINNIEYWYVNQAMTTGYQQSKFAAILRNTEWYQLVRFLLTESEVEPRRRIQDLCARYGLSLAHFRRLSSYALGKTTKVELRDWRLIRALLAFAGEGNMTAVAMDHGYASLSHFSSEVKETFGISAREMKQIIMDG